MLERMKRLAFITICAPAVVLGACNGEGPPAEAEEVDVEQRAVLLCDGSHERNREYYLDANYNVWMGSETCNCYGDSSRIGTRTSYYLEANYSCF